MFAVLLALATFRHEMYLDEVHPWLITRHSRDILDLLHHLRYEGHPALLYFLIYPLSHISNQVAWIKVPNCLFALLMGWLILTERRTEFIIRVLILFSVPVFFEMGVVARNYALAGALLIAASRCLLRDRPRHWLAMVFLALAINSHFLAIPVALGIFVWLYWLAPTPSWRAAAGRLTESRFWISCALLSAALIACYFTLRPAADAYVQEYQYPGVTGLGYLTLGIGKLWHQFLPVPLGMFSALNSRIACAFAPAIAARVEPYDRSLAPGCLGIAHTAEQMVHALHSPALDGGCVVRRACPYRLPRDLHRCHIRHFIVLEFRGRCGALMAA